MKTKLVKRYYCDFCKKANCSSASIRKHEIGCTNNPNRVCGLCRIAGKDQPTMEALKAAVEATVAREYFDGYPTYDLDELTQACPACTLAAIRQFGGGRPFNFDFAGEVKSFWKSINDEREALTHYS